MLLQFKVKNFLSITTEQTFDMRSSDDNETPVKSAVILGANGSGKTYYEDGSWSIFWYRDGKNHFVQCYLSDGTLISESTFKNNILNGMYREYHTTGIIRCKCTYKDGERDGIFKDYYEDGTVHHEVSYKDGKLDGMAKVFYPDGTLRSTRTYKDDVLLVSK